MGQYSTKPFDLNVKIWYDSSGEINRDGLSVSVIH